MGNLDSTSSLEKYDISDMLKLIESFPKQAREAAEIGSKFKLPDTYRCEYANIVCAGLGGSARLASKMRWIVLDTNSSIVDGAGLPSVLSRGLICILVSTNMVISPGFMYFLTSITMLGSST